MATSEVHGAPVLAPPPAPQRSRKAANGKGTQTSPPAAAVDEDDLDTPAEDGELAITDFWELLTSFHPDEWSNQLILYVYRTAPKIDRRGTGQGLYIKKYAEPISEEILKLDHGSGGYRIDLLRLNLATRRTQRISRAYTTICDMEYPPRVPDGEWIEAPENEMWKWSAGAVRTNQAQILHPPPTPQGPSPKEILDSILTGAERLAPKPDTTSTALLTALITGMTAMQSKMMEMNSPAVIMAAVDKAVERATPKDEPKGKKEEDPMVKFLLGELSAMRQELRETRTTQGKSIWEQLDAIMPTIEKIAGSLGFRKGAGAPTKGDLTEVLTTVVEKVGDHIPLLVDAWSRSKDPAAAPAANGGFKLDAPKKAKTAETTTGEPSKTTASATTETAAADEPALTDEERAQLQGILNKFGTVLQQVALFMIDQYKDPDLTGFDFRDWFIRRQGIQWWADMRNECGADNLVKLIQMHAGLRGALQPKERLHGWLHEFFTPQSDGPEPIDPNAVNGQAA